MKNPTRVTARNLIFLLYLANGIPTADAARYLTGKCLLEVNNIKYIDGDCPVSTNKNGNFLIGISEKKPVTYFAIVFVNAKGIGEGFWNEEKGANHAHTPLGKLIRKGACWQNTQAKVCAWR